MGGEERVALDDRIKRTVEGEEPPDHCGDRLAYAAGSQRIAPMVSNAPANS